MYFVPSPDNCSFTAGPSKGCLRMMCSSSTILAISVLTAGALPTVGRTSCPPSTASVVNFVPSPRTSNGFVGSCRKIFPVAGFTISIARATGTEPPHLATHPINLRRIDFSAVRKEMRRWASSRTARMRMRGSTNYPAVSTIMSPVPIGSAYLVCMRGSNEYNGASSRDSVGIPRMDFSKEEVDQYCFPKLADLQPQQHEWTHRKNSIEPGHRPNSPWEHNPLGESAW